MKVIHGIFLGIIILIIIVVIAISISLFIFPQNKIAQRILNGKVYYASDFGIEILISKTDYDNDGIDDYTDILQGAKIEAENKPKYKSAYYSGGYPPDDEGVCTDVIWRALKNAGYSLKDMVDEDIKNNIEEYPRVGGKPDPNIDFRRVPNLIVYFERNHILLTTDLSNIEEWQPGDIVVFSNDHVGIISDKRNEKGIPYLIHNGAQPNREAPPHEFYNENWKKITYHFRLKEVN